MKKLIIIAMLICSGLSSPAFCAPLDRSKIPANASWVIHYDGDSVNNSILMKTWIMGINFAKLSMDRDPQFQGDVAAQAKKQLDDFVTFLNYAREIKTITIVGNEIEKGFAMVVESSASRKKIEKLIGVTAKTSREKYGAHKLVKLTSLTADGALYVCFYNDATIIVSDGKKKIKDQLDLLDGKKKPLSEESELGKILKPGKSTFLFMAAYEPRKILDLKPGQKGESFVRKIKSFSFEAGADNINTFSKLVINASDAEAARDFSEVIKGFFALGRLMKEENEFTRIWIETQKLSIKQKGKTVTVVSSTSILDFFENMRKWQILNLRDMKKNKDKPGAKIQLKIFKTFSGRLPAKVVQTE